MCKMVCPVTVDVQVSNLDILHSFSDYKLKKVNKEKSSYLFKNLIFKASFPWSDMLLFTCLLAEKLVWFHYNKQ